MERWQRASRSGAGERRAHHLAAAQGVGRAVQPHGTASALHCKRRCHRNGVDHGNCCTCKQQRCPKFRALLQSNVLVQVVVTDFNIFSIATFRRNLDLAKAGRAVHSLGAACCAQRFLYTHPCAVLCKFSARQRISCPRTNAQESRHLKLHQLLPRRCSLSSALHNANTPHSSLVSEKQADAAPLACGTTAPALAGINSNAAIATCNAGQPLLSEP